MGGLPWAQQQHNLLLKRSSNELLCQMLPEEVALLQMDKTYLSKYVNKALMR